MGAPPPTAQDPGTAPERSDARVVVIGTGLSGSLAALALARRGLNVLLVGPEPGQAEAATALSYGAMLGRAAIDPWRQLERLHGPLGLRPSGIVLHGGLGSRLGIPPAGLALLTAALPFARVDPPALQAALPAVLAAAGIEHERAVVRGLEPHPAGGWRIHPAAGPPLRAAAVVLAAGAGCRDLWPALPGRLRCSWAGVLALATNPGGSQWLEQARRGRVVQPRHWCRPALEARSGELERGREEWIVDAGLAPWGDGVVVGQITLVRADPEPGPAPDPAWMEARLREGLARLDPALAAVAGPYRQVPVPFCLDGRPLVGPVAGAAGLWVCTGFSGAFGLVPAAAETLAEPLAASLAAAPAAPGAG